jgi:hypothetical protein
MLSPEQAKKLEDQLREGAKELGSAQSTGRKKSGPNGQGQNKQRDGNPDGGSCSAREASSGSCSDNGEPLDGDGSGRHKNDRSAGVDRGPGTQELRLQERPPQLTSNLEESLPAKPGKPGKQGEMIGLSAQAPNENPVNAPVSGGTTTDESGSAGSGWKQNLTPEEKAVLERFYK